jgi:hypothetical protein
MIFLFLCHILNLFFLVSSVLYRREKSFKEENSFTRACGTDELRNLMGHNVATCPNKEQNFATDVTSVGRAGEGEREGFGEATDHVLEL